MSDRETHRVLVHLRASGYAALDDDQLDELVRGACAAQLERKMTRMTLASFLGACKVADLGCVHRIANGLRTFYSVDTWNCPVANVEGYDFPADAHKRILSIGPSSLLECSGIGTVTMLAMLWSIVKHSALTREWEARPAGMWEPEWQRTLLGELVNPAALRRWSRRKEGKPFAEEVTVYEAAKGGPTA